MTDPVHRTILHLPSGTEPTLLDSHTSEDDQGEDEDGHGSAEGNDQGDDHNSGHSFDR